jgi:hypothetical protein
MILKAYILLSFIIALFFWLSILYNRKVKNFIFRFLFFPLILGIVGFVSMKTILYLANNSDKYQIKHLQSTVQGYQSFHSSLGDEDGGGSSYSLGDIDFTPLGLLKEAPLALNATYFRPYIWEVRSFLMIPSAIESLILLYLTFYLLFVKIGIRQFFIIINANEFIILCFTFSVVLGFAVGFSSFNFGALVRYKIPALMFYTIGLSILYNEYMIKTNKRTIVENYLKTSFRGNQSPRKV